MGNQKERKKAGHLKKVHLVTCNNLGLGLICKLTWKEKFGCYEVFFGGGAGEEGTMKIFFLKIKILKH
jgi:hypothetical protein